MKGNPTILQALVLHFAAKKTPTPTLREAIRPFEIINVDQPGWYGVLRRMVDQGWLEKHDLGDRITGYKITSSGRAQLDHVKEVAKELLA